MNTPYKDKKRLRNRLIIYSSLMLLLLCTIGMGSAFVSAQTNILAHNASRQKNDGKSTTTSHTASKAKTGNTSLFSIAQQSGDVPASIPIDTLSANLASYLTTLDPDAGVEVYDVTHQRSYTYSSTAQFFTGSSIKVPIMLAFFSQTESQGREPDGDEMNLLTTMIENSDNDAASALYVDINGAAGLTSYLDHIGVSGLVPDNDAWGDSLITPQTMVDLLTQLHNGTILTAPDRATALHLMENVEPDQQWGVGDTAPKGATFAIKNGWLPTSDGLWTVSTSGIVNTGGETYILSVYTREQPSLATAQAVLQNICSAVVSSLT